MGYRCTSGSVSEREGPDGRQGRKTTARGIYSKMQESVLRFLLLSNLVYADQQDFCNAFSVFSELSVRWMGSTLGTLRTTLHYAKASGKGVLTNTKM